MESNTTESKLCALIEDFSKASVASLDRDIDLIETLGIDSLAALRMLAMIEKRMNVVFANEELASLRTKAKLVDAIDRASKPNQRR